MSTKIEEKLQAADILGYSALAMEEVEKHKKNNRIMEMLSSSSYLCVKPSNKGGDIVVRLLEPYIYEKCQLQKEEKYGSNDIKVWSYCFRKDIKTDGTVSLEKIVWLPVSAKDYVNDLHDIVVKTYDTMINMLGLSLSSTLTVDQADPTGYIETMISLGDFNTASRFAAVNDITLKESLFNQQVVATKLFNSVISYMLAVAKHNLNNEGTVLDESVPFIGVSGFVGQEKDSQSRVIKGFGRNDSAEARMIQRIINRNGR